VASPADLDDYPADWTTEMRVGQIASSAFWAGMVFATGVLESNRINQWEAAMQPVRAYAAKFKHNVWVNETRDREIVRIRDGEHLPFSKIATKLLLMNSDWSKNGRKLSSAAVEQAYRRAKAKFETSHCQSNN
jgi:hypothetical protein